MILNDSARWRGEVHSYVFEGDLDPDRLGLVLDDRTQPEWGRLVSEEHHSNLVTNAGRAQMTARLVGETTGAGWMGLTTSVPALALTDIALANEGPVTRVALSLAQQFLSYYQRYVGLFTTVSFGNTGINGEAIFDAASTGGNMWAEASISLSKTTTQAAVIDHRIQLTT